MPRKGAIPAHPTLASGRTNRIAAPTNPPRTNSDLLEPPSAARDRSRSRVLATLLLPRAQWWFALVAALAFSTTVELLQMLATDRTSTVQDAVANALGAAIGILAVTLARAKPDKPQGRPIP